jgi:hypothetical protein
MIEGGESNVIKRTHIQGFDKGIVGKDTKDLKIIDTDIKK